LRGILEGHVLRLVRSPWSGVNPADIFHHFELQLCLEGSEGSNFLLERL
jgi:hypothetical protein